MAVAPLGSGERVLIVEDTHGARDVAQRMLTSIGYEVTVASNASEALEILATGQTFDVLFTDIIMPGPHNGLALARLVRERDAHIKVLFTSGFSNMTAKELSDLRAIYVAKPYRKAEITKVLRELLAE